MDNRYDQKGRTAQVMPYITIKTNNMTSLGKKILSVFVENEEGTRRAVAADSPAGAANDHRTTGSPGANASSTDGTGIAPDPATSRRFTEYFDKLFCDANIPGPDYYEFSRMTEAM